MKVVIEYVIYDLGKWEIKNAVEQVEKQHEQKYGCISWYEVYEKTNIEIFDKLKNIGKKCLG